MLSTKFMNFLTMSWLISTLICLIMEGSYFGASQVSATWDLSLFTKYDIAGLFSIPVMNTGFLDTLWKILSWDYSFYTGVYSFIRWIWLVIFTPGAVWGLYQAFSNLYGYIISLFRILV